MKILSGNVRDGKNNFFKRIIYNLFLNGIAFLISVISILILPKLIGVETYSYYQLYIFYVSYVAVLNFGWNDGIYLRIGGEKYNELDKKLLSTQYYALFLLETVIYIAIFIFCFYNTQNTVEIVVYSSVCIAAIIINPRWFLLYILNATGRNSEYSSINVIEKIISITFIIVCSILKYNNIFFILISDLIGKIISTLICMLYCKDIIKSTPYNIKKVLNEIKINIKVGFNLMIASLSSMLILGVVRLGIERNWDVVTFGKISLTISISNMLMQFVMAISNVLYPTLRRQSQDKLPEIYKILKMLINILIFTFLVFYYPLEKLLTLWLPNYADSLRYAAILFPVCFYECRTNLIGKTYLQALRHEKILMFCNMVSLIMSIVLTLISTLILDNLFFAIFSIIIVLAFRGILIDIKIGEILNIDNKIDILLESILVIIFIFGNWFLYGIGSLMYLVALIIYIFINMKNIKYSISTLKNILN